MPPPLEEREPPLSELRAEDRACFPWCLEDLWRTGEVARPPEDGPGVSCSLEEDAASPGMWLELEKLELDSD